jgi:predicted nucleic acid-binding protein
LIVLLDTDILVDVALDREPYAENAAALLDALEHRPGSAFIAWHTVSNFYYLLAPKRGRSGARAFLVDLSRFVEVARTTTESLRYAAQLKMKDFEDAMQVAAAAACEADVIATRNVRDYAKSPIRAATPGALLDELV